jgi:hypothetical protein
MIVMSDPAPSEKPSLQFETAEPVAAPGAPEATAPAPLTCTSCKQPLTSEYYEASGQTLCPACRQALATAFAAPLGKERFVLSLVYGGVAAVGGGLLWWAVRALTGYEIGLIAVVVGLMVGLAVRAGSLGRGGRRFQILAVCLTYSGVALNYVPDIFKGFAEAARTRPAPTKDDATAGEGAPAAGKPANPVPVATSTAASSGATAAEQKPFGVLHFALFLVFVAGLAFAAPFLAGAENVIGILIIGFALWEAWKLNRQAQLAFTGPFQVNSPAAGEATPLATP